MYKFYSECIAISQDATSFNVQINYVENKGTPISEMVGQASCLLNRNLRCTSINVCLKNTYVEDYAIIEDKIFQHCVERYRAILGEEEKES